MYDRHELVLPSGAAIDGTQSYVTVDAGEVAAISEAGAAWCCVILRSGSQIGVALPAKEIRRLCKQEMSEEEMNAEWARMSCDLELRAQAEAKAVTVRPGAIVQPADGKALGVVLRKPNDRPEDSGEWVVAWLSPHQGGSADVLQWEDALTVVGHLPSWDQVYEAPR